MRAGIENYLQTIRPQRSPLNSAMLQRSLRKSSTPIVKAGGEIAGAGLFGTPGSLPGDPGGVEPPILVGGGDYGTGTPPTTPSYSLGPSWDTPNPSPNQYGSGPFGGSTTQPYDPETPYPTEPIPAYNPNNPNEFGSINPVNNPVSFGPGGQLRGGNNGPQGSVYGINPNTGNPIYNVTGSPRPGFFDSRTGKFVATAASAGLNMFIPGLGFVSKAIFDAIRNRQNARNTGTDLSGNTPSGSPPPESNPSGPAWFQPGYQPPAGIQGAIARGDYQTAYGPSLSARESAKIMGSQAFGGSPNSTGTTTDAGHTINFFGSGGFHGTQGGPTPYASNQNAVNSWLMATPQYKSWLNNRLKPGLPRTPPLQITPAGG